VNLPAVKGRGRPRIIIETRRPEGVVLGTSRLPWTVNSLLLLVFGNVVALVLIVAGWYGASTRGTVSSQGSWVDTAILGAILAGVLDCVWLLRGRRAVGQQRRALITAESWRVTSGVPPQVAGTATTGESGPLVRVAGMIRVHHSDCPLVVGKATKVVRRPANQPRCGICGT
jgi:hypothetical protein